MSTRRRASGSATSDGALLLYDYAGSEDNEDLERQHDHSELNNPEYFESLDYNGTAESSEDGHAKTLGVKTGREKWYRIYVLHLLFMWNLRTYEFASIVLISTAFPDSLAPAAIRGIASTVPAMLFSSAIGNWIDRSQSRLKPLLTSVYLSHSAIALSYLVWLLWPIIPSDGYGDEDSEPKVSALNAPKGLLFSVIILLDVIHNMSSIANRISLERDWVPVLVGQITPELTYGLTQVNAVMKRLDLVSKLVAPTIIPFVIAVFNFREGWITLLATSTVVFMIIEVRSMHVIVRENPELRALKNVLDGLAADEGYKEDYQYGHINSGFRSWPRRMHVAMYKNPVARLTQYFSMPVWPASMAECLAQMTVLAYSSTLITYLLTVGFSLGVVTIARASGTIMGLASTFIAPMAANFVRRRKSRRFLDRNTAGDDIEGAVVRNVGIWGISSQVLCMVPVVFVLWSFSLNLNPKLQESHDDSTDASTSTISPHIIQVLILFSFLSLSRIGHLLFGLMVQEIAQVEIPSDQRSTFAGTEQSFGSMFKLCHWGATMVWSAPRDFRFLALGSLIALISSATIFTAWAKRPRVSANIAYEEAPLDGIDTHAD